MFNTKCSRESEGSNTYNYSLISPVDYQWEIFDRVADGVYGYDECHIHQSMFMGDMQLMHQIKTSYRSYVDKYRDAKQIYGQYKKVSNKICESAALSYDVYQSVGNNFLWNLGITAGISLAAGAAWKLFDYYHKNEIKISRVTDEWSNECIRRSLSSYIPAMNTTCEQLTLCNSTLKDYHDVVTQLIPNTPFKLIADGDYLPGTTMCGYNCVNYIADDTIQENYIITPQLEQRALDSLLLQKKCVIMLCDDFSRIIPIGKGLSTNMGLQGERHKFNQHGKAFDIINDRYPQVYTPKYNRDTKLSEIFNPATYINHAKSLNYDVTYVRANRQQLFTIFTPTSKSGSKELLDSTYYGDKARGVHVQLLQETTKNGCESTLYYGLPGSDSVYSTTFNIACVMSESKHNNENQNMVSQAVVASTHGEPHPELLKYVQVALIDQLCHIYRNRMIIVQSGHELQIDPSEPKFTDSHYDTFLKCVSKFLQFCQSKLNMPNPPNPTVTSLNHTNNVANQTYNAILPDSDDDNNSEHTGQQTYGYTQYYLSDEESESAEEDDELINVPQDVSSETSEHMSYDFLDEESQSGEEIEAPHDMFGDAVTATVNTNDEDIEHNESHNITTDQTDEELQLGKEISQPIEEDQVANDEKTDCMSAPQTLLYVALEIVGTGMCAIVDSAAEKTMMSYNMAQRMQLEHFIDTRFSGVAQGIGESKILGIITDVVTIVGDRRLLLDYHILDTNQFDLILGLDSIRRHRMIINLSTYSLDFHGTTVPFTNVVPVVPEIYDKVVIDVVEDCEDHTNMLTVAEEMSKHFNLKTTATKAVHKKIVNNIHLGSQHYNRDTINDIMLTRDPQLDKYSEIVTIIAANNYLNQKLSHLFDILTKKNCNKEQNVPIGNKEESVKERLGYCLSINEYFTRTKFIDIIINNIEHFKNNKHASQAENKSMIKKDEFVGYTSEVSYPMADLLGRKFEDMISSELTDDVRRLYEQVYCRELDALAVRSDNKCRLYFTILKLTNVKITPKMILDQDVDLKCLLFLSHNYANEYRALQSSFMGDPIKVFMMKVKYDETPDTSNRFKTTKMHNGKEGRSLDELLEIYRPLLTMEFEGEPDITTDHVDFRANSKAEHRNNLKLDKEFDKLFTNSKIVHSLDTEPGELVAENKPLMHKIGHDLTPGSHVAGYTKGTQGAQAAFITRVSNVYNGVKNKELALKLIGTTIIIANRIFNANHVKLEEEEYVNSLTTHNQKQRMIDLNNHKLDNLKATGKKATVHNKDEMGNKPLVNDRNITAVSTKCVFESSLYTKVVVDEVKKHIKTYAFGKTSKNVASLIYQLASRCETFLIGDFSKYDGTQNEFTRAIDIIMIAACFHTDEFKTITNTFLNSNNDIYTSNESLRMNLGATRLSGSAETSVSNTLLNAMVNVLARLYQGQDHFQDTSEYTNEELRILFNMSIYAGDDGVSMDLHEDHLLHIVKALGMKMTLEKRVYGQPLDFLARYYPTPHVHASSASILDRETIKLAYGSKNTSAKNEQLKDKLNSRLVNELGNNQYGDKLIKTFEPLMEKFDTNYKLVKLGYDHKATVGAHHKLDLEQEVINIGMQNKDTMNNIDMVSGIKTPEQIEEQLGLHNKVHARPGWDIEAEKLYLQNLLVNNGYIPSIVKDYDINVLRYSYSPTMLSTMDNVVKIASRDSKLLIYDHNYRSMILGGRYIKNKHIRYEPNVEKDKAGFISRKQSQEYQNTWISKFYNLNGKDLDHMLQSYGKNVLNTKIFFNDTCDDPTKTTMRVYKFISEHEDQQAIVTLGKQINLPHHNKYKLVLIYTGPYTRMYYYNKDVTLKLFKPKVEIMETLTNTKNTSVILSQVTPLIENVRKETWAEIVGHDRGITTTSTVVKLDKPKTPRQVRCDYYRSLATSTKFHNRENYKRRQLRKLLAEEMLVNVIEKLEPDKINMKEIVDDKIKEVLDAWDDGLFHSADVQSYDQITPTDDTVYITGQTTQEFKVRRKLNQTEILTKQRDHAVKMTEKGYKYVMYDQDSMANLQDQTGESGHWVKRTENIKSRSRLY